MKFYNNGNEHASSTNHASRPTEVNKDEPCIHCGKPDWCYRLGALSVCKRDADPAHGWEKTKKADKEGTPYYAPAQPKKSIRLAGRKEFFYPDRSGNPLIKVTRIDDGKGHRDFFQSHWDGKRWVLGLPENTSQVPIYRYCQVSEAIAAGKTIFLVEGEGCADKLWQIGLAATTTLGGSSKYRSYGDYQQDLINALLVLCPDRDEPGLEHMEKIAQDFPNAKWLYAPPNEFFWQHLPPSSGLDIADWIADGATADDICAAVKDRWVALAESLGNTVSKSSTTLTSTSPKNKTIGELEAEIITAATSKNPKLALTQVAAHNSFPANLVEEIAKSLLQEQGLEAAHDLDKTEYVQCIEQIRDLELKIADPGERAWKMQSLARKYHRTEAQLRDSFCKSLIAQHLSDPLTLTQLKEVYGEGREWLMRGWIPKHSLILLHAHGGLGKTLFTHHLIKHLAAGKDWDEYKVREQKNILYIQTDTAPNNLIESLKQIGIDDDASIVYHVSWQIEYTQQLYGWVQRYRPALVVIDSLTSVSRSSQVSENDTFFAKPILYMGDIAREMGCSFLLIHHSNGEGQMRGTKAIRNAVDEVWRLESVDPKNAGNPERILVQEKSRSRMPMRYKLKFNDDDYSWESLGLDQSEDEPPQNTSARWLIVNHLEKYPGIRFGVVDLAQAISIPEATVRRELPNLFREGLVDREPNPKFAGGHSKGESKHLFFTQQYEKNC